MGPGPVFEAELRTQARRARSYVARAAYGLFLFWILLQSFASSFPGSWGAPGARPASVSEVGAFAQATFFSVELFQAVAVLALTPVLVAGSIAGERQRKTLHYLIASRLTSAEVVVGKLLARLLLLGVILAVGLPVLILLTRMGGVDPRLVAMGLAVDVSMAVFLGGLAILVSSRATRAATAIGRTYALGLAWLCLPPIITTIGSNYWIYEWIRPAYIWVDASNPVLLLYDFWRGPAVWVERLEWMIGLQIAAGAGFVGVAVWRLRPAFRRGEGRRALGSALGRHGWRWRLFARPPIGDDPVRWKEFHTSRTTGLAKLLGLLLGLAVAGMVGYAASYLARPAFEDLWHYGYGRGGIGRFGPRGQFGTFVGVIGSFFSTTMMLGVAATAASRVSSEREEGCWTSLVATPLDGREILLPKLLGALRSVRWVLLMPGALWLVGLAAGSVHPLALVVLVAELGVYGWFAAALGTFLSLTLRTTSRAQAATVVVLLVANVLTPILFSLSRREGATMFVACSPVVVASSAFGYGEARAVIVTLTRNPGTLLVFPSPRDWSVACELQTLLVSLACHALAAWSLTVAAIRRFDRVVDRPRRTAGAGVAPPASKATWAAAE